MKAVLVTGANRGLGFGICRRVLDKYKDTVVIVSSRNKKAAEEAVHSLNRIHNTSNAIPLQLDVTKEESISEASKELQRYLSSTGYKLDAIINNAGVGFDFPWSKKPFHPEIASKTIECNFYGVLRVCSYFTPMLEKRGRIVHISSNSALSNVSLMSDENRKKLLEQPTLEVLEECAKEFIVTYKKSVLENDHFEPHLSTNGWWLQSYGFSKALVNSLTMVQAKEYPEFVVNSCAPGFIGTDLTKSYEKYSTLLSVDKGSKCPVLMAFSGLITSSGKLYKLENEKLTESPWFGSSFY